MMKNVSSLLAKWLLHKQSIFLVDIENSDKIELSVSYLRYTNGHAIVRKKSLLHHTEWQKVLKKWKNQPALLILISNQTISKPYNESDPVFNRILHNQELFCDINLQTNTVSFLRKSSVQKLSGLMGKYHIILTDIWIYDNLNTDLIHERLEDLRANCFVQTMLMKTDNASSILTNCLFHRLLLPALLTFFILLLGNFLLNIRYTTLLEESRALLQNAQRTARHYSVTDSRKSKIQTVYDSFPNYAVALPADRIASYLPSGIKLTSMILYPCSKKTSSDAFTTSTNVIKVDGTSDIAGKVSLLCQYLESDNLFSTVRMVSLIRNHDKALFRFTLEIQPAHE